MIIGVLPIMTVKYPVGVAGKAEAAPADPTVAWVVGLANVRSPKMIGRVMVVDGN